MCAASPLYLGGCEPPGANAPASPPRNGFENPLATLPPIPENILVRFGGIKMTKAIDHIVAGYVTLKNRIALEEIRDHRRKLLNENRMRTGPLRFDSINMQLQEELSAVEVGLDRLSGLS